MNKQNTIRTVTIIAAMWIAFMLFNGIASNAMIKTIPYSEFLTLAKDGKVSEITVTDNIIQGKMFTDDATSEQGLRFQTVRVDSEISDVLDPQQRRRRQGQVDRF